MGYIVTGFDLKGVNEVVRGLDTLSNYIHCSDTGELEGMYRKALEGIRSNRSLYNVPIFYCRHSDLYNNAHITEKVKPFVEDVFAGSLAGDDLKKLAYFIFNRCVRLFKDTYKGEVDPINITIVSRKGGYLFSCYNSGYELEAYFNREGNYLSEITPKKSYIKDKDLISAISKCIKSCCLGSSNSLGFDLDCLNLVVLNNSLEEMPTGSVYLGFKKGNYSYLGGNGEDSYSGIVVLDNFNVALGSTKLVTVTGLPNYGTYGKLLGNTANPKDIYTYVNGLYSSCTPLLSTKNPVIMLHEESDGCVWRNFFIGEEIGIGKGVGSLVRKIVISMLKLFEGTRDTSGAPIGITISQCVDNPRVAIVGVTGVSEDGSRGYKYSLTEGKFIEKVGYTNQSLILQLNEDLRNLMLCFDKVPVHSINLFSMCPITGAEYKFGNSMYVGYCKGALDFEVDSDPRLEKCREYSVGIFF